MGRELSGGVVRVARQHLAVNVASMGRHDD
jgi:hypothetical protein